MEAKAARWNDTAPSMTRRAHCTVLCLASLIGASLFTGHAYAQTQSSSPTKTTNSPHSLGAYDGWFVRSGATCGAGVSNSSVATKPTVQCGAIAGIMPFFDLETGVMGPQANRSDASVYLSTNAWMPLIPFKQLGNRHGVPLVVGGYTRMFETGNALDYGVAFSKPIDHSHSIQFEVRDYRAFANPNQHNIVFRVVWLVGLSD